jgi:hypothetical protein
MRSRFHHPPPVSRGESRKNRRRGPFKAIGTWAKQLQPGGLLLLEEVDTITANVPDSADVLIGSLMGFGNWPLCVEA